MGNNVRFDCYEVDLLAGQLYRRGTRVNLRDKSFQILAALLEHPGELVTRESLRQHLWREDVFVDFENNLNTAIARLRDVLHDSTEHPRFIETLPRRGYRFIASVSAEDTAAVKVSKPKARLLVMPFLNLTGDPDQEYFSGAMTDEIITALAGLAPDRLAVLARGTSLHFKKSRKSLEDIRRELNVDYFVEGGVRRAGDGLGVNIQLIQSSDLTHLFAGQYEGAMHDLFNLHESIAQAIAAHLPVLADRVRTEAMGAVRGPIVGTERLAACNEYIQGRHLFVMAKLSPEGFINAKQHLEQAVALDPDYALAHDALAEVYWYLGYFGFVSPRKAFSAGIVHALRALEIDNTRAETHALLGQFHKIAEYNWPEVHREMSLALHLNPNSPEVKMRYAVSELMPQGRLEEAITELGYAVESDPLSPLPRSWLGIMRILSRQYEHCAEESEKILKIDPTSPTANFLLAQCHRYRKNFGDALAYQHRAVEYSGGTAMMLGWLGLTLAECGEIAEAKSILNRLHQMQAKGYVPPCSFAWIHLALKDLDTAFEWLDRAVDECDQFLMPIKSYGFFDPIRGDSRFASLLHKMNLA